MANMKPPYTTGNQRTQPAAQTPEKLSWGQAYSEFWNDSQEPWLLRRAPIILFIPGGLEMVAALAVPIAGELNDVGVGAILARIALKTIHHVAQHRLPAAFPEA